jgi:site-specific recombinase XerD
MFLLRSTGSQGDEVNETHPGEKRPGSFAADESIDLLLKDFDRHLEGQHGCADGTRRHYQREARAFLLRVFPTKSINWGELTAGKVAEYVGSRANQLSLVSRQNPAIAIRSLLRFLAGEGLIRAGLEGAIPPIWRTKHATVPRHVSPEQLESILALCVSEDRPRAMRDRAMLLLCARLGLRPSEVLSLTVDDLDWSAGCVLIRAGKTSRERLLPLPEDAGAALAGYLRKARPVSNERAAFLSLVPPHKPLRDVCTLINLVNRLLRQAGIGAPCSGSYVLRHTLATTMVRTGVSFKQVADILGHSSLTTTGIYAKLDLPSLVKVALPWPGAAQ